MCALLLLHLQPRSTIVGPRDRRVHDGMNVDMAQVLELVAQEREQDRARFVVGFCWGGELVNLR